MAKRSKTKLTFAVTIDQPAGATIPDVRSFIKDALLGEQRARNMDDPIKAIHIDEVKCHLLNKETHYG